MCVYHCVCARVCVCESFLFIEFKDIKMRIKKRIWTIAVVEISKRMCNSYNRYIRIIKMNLNISHSLSISFALVSFNFLSLCLIDLSVNHTHYILCAFRPFCIQIIIGMHITHAHASICRFGGVTLLKNRLTQKLINRTLNDENCACVKNILIVNTIWICRKKKLPRKIHTDERKTNL